MLGRPVLLVLLSSIGGGAAAADQLALAVGKGSENSDVWRLAWQRPWHWQTSFAGNGFLSGFHALSFNRWRKDNESITALGYSPVFTWRRGSSPWYLQGGIGVAYLDRTRIAGRILSSHWQFEDQLGIGWQRGRYDLGLVYRHYSNAGFSKPNHGIDLVLFSCALQLD
ncbi:acyloxyacyl hydrolase [Thiohalophilus sp.]|uniref:acyloxyacyl hydrolase n=1 Tax=Thiohalophilus sp. TaxID=3028392 RepID=UPI002ACEF742|nr:acyloxyacyl hydrolase [Thiohalophilus sp.]MDZ7805443.1 acyloxyacyl hydrolase [Thiohalophilus sp.]